MTRHSSNRAPRGANTPDGSLHTSAIPLSTFHPANPSSPTRHRTLSQESIEFSDDEMQHRQPTHTAGVQSQQPLLREDKAERPSYEYGQPTRPGKVSGRRNLHAHTAKHSPPEDNTKQRYIYASLCLVIALISFVVQTETSVYIQHELHWNKAYCMLWFTHGSWIVLWPTQLLIIRLQKRKMPWATFWRRHKYLLKTTAQMVQHQDLKLSASTTATSPIPYMLKTIAAVTTFLTFAGASWYVAVDLTTASDLTAIYNCSAFFAYVFSILLLNDKLRTDKILSVGLAIVGVLVVAYGDTEDTHPKTGSQSGGSTNPAPESPPDNRFLGNLIIGIGSVLYGLYEVLYKKYACPPEGTSPQRGMIFANTVGSMIGAFTLTVLWIPLPILHFTGIEPFEMPSRQVAGYLAISTLTNATFSGAFLVLMSLTSPVLSSVAALLTIFLVAITDWLLTGKDLSAAAILGGSLIIIAFLMLSWATYREMQEHAKQQQEEEDKVFSDEDFEEQFVVDGRDSFEGEDSDEEITVPGSDKRRHRTS